MPKARQLFRRTDLTRAIRETATGEAKRVDAVKRAEAAWRHFAACMKALSPEQAAPLWRAAQAQVAVTLGT